MNYEELARALTTTDIIPGKFDHRDHVAVAFELLKANEFLTACHLYADAVRGLAGRLGVPDKFNLTITVAFLALVSEHMAETGTDDVEEFLERNAQLLDKNLLKRWYPEERLASKRARDTFLMPKAAQAV